MQPTPSMDPPEALVLPTREGYDLWAALYDAEDNPLIALEEPHVTRQLGDVRGLRVADVGCGTGRHAWRLAAAGADVTAVDFSPGMLEKARAKNGSGAIQFVVHDLARPLPFAAGSFDRVLSALVLDHIADLPLFFAELHRVVRPSGLIVASAMHPAMMLRGIQARFVDPGTGRETRPRSCANQVSDYVMAATGAGLVFEHLGEHAVDSALAERSPRAAKYLDWPMLLMMTLRPAARPLQRP